jgi:hypothetical protein
VTPVMIFCIVYRRPGPRTHCGRLTSHCCDRGVMGPRCRERRAHCDWDPPGQGLPAARPARDIYRIWVGQTAASRAGICRKLGIPLSAVLAILALWTTRPEYFASGAYKVRRRRAGMIRNPA